MTAAAGRGNDRATIRRGTQPRKRAVPKGRAKKPAVRKSLLAALPPPVAAIARRAANYALVAVLIGGVAAGIIAMGLPQMIGIEIGEGIGKAGFAVKKVEITGIDRMDRAPVEDAAFSAQELAMPLVDIGEIRGKLLQQGWVKDARVSRRLPDTLVIDIVEREPAAIWQHRQRLHLIDADGRVIEQLRLSGSPLPDLPILIGPNANYQVAALDRLLQASPQLKPMLDGASWVGDRRWDIRFRSGETLSLPEGEGQARAALADFAERDGNMRLLGQGMLRFDMRNPGRIIVRPAPKPTTEQQAASVRPAVERDDGAEPPPAKVADARSI